MITRPRVHRLPAWTQPDRQCHSTVTALSLDIAPVL